MAIERLTDYTRRIWTGLSSDGPDPDMQAGDVIYYMDTSTCSIITGIPAPGSIDTEDLPDVGGGGPTENFIFKLHNQTGSIMNFISMYYDAAVSNITLFIYAQQSNNSRVQKTCLIQNGKVQLAYYNDRNINSITYNGNPIPFTQSGSSGRRYVEFDVPANFDPNIDIIFT